MQTSDGRPIFQAVLFEGSLDEETHVFPAATREEAEAFAAQRSGGTRFRLENLDERHSKSGNVDRNAIAATAESARGDEDLDGPNGETLP